MMNFIKKILIKRFFKKHKTSSEYKNYTQMKSQECARCIYRLETEA